MRRQQRLAGRRLLSAFAREHPRAFFVEIGANDGDHQDHLGPLIRSGAWSGIMVEPLPQLFERLRRNYGSVPGIMLENVAIAEREGKLPFYYLAEPSAEEWETLPDWYELIGSFSAQTILVHEDVIPDVRERLRETEVPCLTFEALCERHGVRDLDLLVIDTEGYDHEILKTINLDRFHPRVIVYEHFHLSPADRRACREMIEAAGYETLEEGLDTFCLDPRGVGRLARTWRRLRPAEPGLSAQEVHGSHAAA